MGRKSREGAPALSHADIRGYPTGESGVTHFHGLLAGDAPSILFLLLAEIYGDNGFSLDRHALSSALEQVAETIPSGWREGIGKRSWKYDSRGLNYR